MTQSVSESMPVDCAHAQATSRRTIVSCDLGLLGGRPHIALCRDCRQRKPTGGQRCITVPQGIVRLPLAEDTLAVVRTRGAICRRCEHQRGVVFQQRSDSVYQVNCALRDHPEMRLIDGSCPAGKWPVTRLEATNTNGQSHVNSVQEKSGRQKLVLKTHLSPGDIVMLTAAVRDLHRAHPNKFLTAVETSAADLWENNPYVIKFAPSDSDIRVIPMHYPLVNQSNQRPAHFLRGYTEYLETQLGLRIPTTEFRGDIHISDTEKGWANQVQDNFGYKGPFWLIFAGGKYDFTTKWWSPDYYQKVVDHFFGRVQFVQCGEAAHWHPGLKGVFNLVGKTSLRQLVRLVYHAAGIICPVTLAMHLAAAVPTKAKRLRPCVVIAGGREPPHWEAYPGHQYLHTVGMLACCATGGCWKSRCHKVGDNDPKDRDNLCERPVPVNEKLTLPQCMTMIRPDTVVRAVECFLTDQTWNFI